ncbi:sugar ABC transporter permease [Arthrobacter sp. BE255]|uniref:carbohydrate ABC transporter permease n=1 Tax=Arthrobacter sp. BE255 TaxID=2817721 RepID=UPI002859EC28|nr:sugar ABC transporter permease [Arthrobacter sp. BE255]MDR7159163.1 raffinose/stachyose/melibiose transport system permease protein [Arthrobacter sp. BE255]
MKTITTTSAAPAQDPAPQALATRRPRKFTVRRAVRVLWILPALALYGTFVLYPLTQGIRFSFYDWDGVGVATPAGFENYTRIFTQPEFLSAIGHAFILIIFFSIVPVFLGLLVAAIMRELKPGPFSTTARVVLFLPQVMPLAGAGIAWTWMYSENGVVNQILRGVGLGALAKPWLGDFASALSAVGFIGSWVALGLCTMLLLAGIGKIDHSFYEAAQIDGAGPVRQFFAITLPSLRRELVVCVTVTVIAALASFDVIFVTTNGGPGFETMVPSVFVYRLAFVDNQVGQASALAIFLAILILAVILPLQRLSKED